MTGIIDSVIGMDTKICIERTRKQVLYRMEPAALTDSTPGADGKVTVQGIIAEFDAETGKALSIRRI
jgi:calcineurin-like phosphoesterase